jgi:putative nucleotidyltransferase with HDIG domain
MTRKNLATAYTWAVVAVGLCVLAVTATVQAPTDLAKDPSGLAINSAILLVLVFLSSVSPMQTRIGTVVSVSLAPLFGAVLVLPAWAVMVVAALGTIDERLPGIRIPWDRFLFNRGMFILSYGLPALILHSLPKETWPALLPFVVALIVALNVGQLSVAFSLTIGLGVLTSARRMLAGQWFTYIALPLIGVLIYVILNQNSFQQRLLVFLLYGPLLVYRASLQKQNRLDQWLRDSFIMQSRVVDKRDGQTHGHSQRVGEMSEGVARALHMSDEQCNTIRTAGILHDLGKIAIPDSILLKPGKLTPEEYEIIKTHPVEGAQILAEHPEQKGVAAIVMHHHERWDGKGYPDGIAAESIPIGSRIVNACDAFDTITQARVFRPTVKTPAEAIAELRQLAGTWYDPTVITALEKIVSDRWGVQIAPHAEQAVVKNQPYREVFAIRPFRRLWFGQAVSFFGDWMNTAGLAIMLFVVTHSASVVALGLISKALPTVIFGLIAGPLVDRFNRQRIMIMADIVRGILTVTIPFWALTWLPGVFIVVFGVATASAFFNPAKQAMLPNLIPNRLLVRANGIMFSTEKGMELIGYSAAGLIAAAFSWIPLFFVDAATYFVSAVSLLSVGDARPGGALGKLTVLKDIREGAVFIWRNRLLGSTMTVTTMCALLGGMTVPLLVVMAYGPLKGKALGYGLLEAALGAGVVLGALMAARAVARFRAGALILAGVAGIGVAYALIGLAGSLWLALLLIFAQGVANMIYYVPLVSITQREAPDYIRGRVMSTRFLLVQLGLLTGMTIAGPLADRIGAPAVFTTAGVLIVCVALVGTAFGSLRRATLDDDAGSPPLKAASG